MSAATAIAKAAGVVAAEAAEEAFAKVAVAEAYAFARLKTRMRSVGRSEDCPSVYYFLL